MSSVNFLTNHVCTEALCKVCESDFLKFIEFSEHDCDPHEILLTDFACEICLGIKHRWNRIQYYRKKIAVFKIINVTLSLPYLNVIVYVPISSYSYCDTLF